MNFEVMAYKVLEECFNGYGLKFEKNCEEVFEESARFYFDDSMNREWQIILESDGEFEIQERIGEDWFTSCSGKLK